MDIIMQRPVPPSRQPKVNLLEKLPTIPAEGYRLRNYRDLAILLEEEPHGGSGRSGHLKHIRKFLEFHHEVGKDGKKKHSIVITKILNPTYVKWVSFKRKYAYNATLVLSHLGAQAREHQWPNRMSQDIADHSVIVVTTHELCSKLGLGNRNLSLWRRGKLEIEDLDANTQQAQYDLFYKFLDRFVRNLKTTQIFLQQFSLKRWWVLLYSDAGADQLWRLASSAEQEQIKALQNDVLADFGLASIQMVFLTHQEEVFYKELVARIKKAIPSVENAWYIWWITVFAECEHLSHEDLEIIYLELNTGVAEWALGSGIDSQIIDMVINK